VKDRKVYKILKFLDVYELNSLRKYLLSPFFNQNQGCIKLFDLVVDYMKADPPIEYTNEQIWHHVQGENIPFVDVKLRKLFSDLFGLIEDFLMQTELQADKDQCLYLKLKAIKQRNIKDMYAPAIAEAQQLQKLRQNKSAEYYLHQYNEQKFIQEFKLDGDIVSRREDLDQKLNLEEVSMNLDIFFIAEKLRYYANLLAWNRSYNINQKIVGIDIILKLAKSPIFRDFPPVAIYFTIVQTYLDEANEEHYEKLKGLMDKYLHLFPRDEAKAIYEAILGYSVTKSNKGDSRYDKEAFELYKKSIDLELIFQSDKTISPREFRNIVFYGIRQNDYKWVEEFINSFNIYLDPLLRESNVNFSLARLEMNRKNYLKVIELLAYTDYTEVFQALLSRTLLLASYYELKEYDSLESLFASFKLYLDREKSLAESRKEQYYNLIKFTKRLMKLTRLDRPKIFKLREEIENSIVVNRAWLLEKIDDILC
jgi:hypothetical protein